MTQPLTDLTLARSRQLSDEYPWVWLYDIEVPTTPPTRYRLTNYDRNFSFDATSSGVPLVYEPFPIVQGPVTQASDGDLPQIQLQVANESQIMRTILEDHDGLVGQPIVIRLVHILQQGDPSAALRFDGQIVACKATYDRVAWNVSALNLTQSSLPGRRYIRDHCRWRYGDANCGYDLNNSTLSTAQPSCRKTLADCEAHGDSEVAAGLSRQHPARFGGWPGIPRQGRR